MTCAFIEEGRQQTKTGWRGINVKNPDGTWMNIIKPQTISSLPKKYEIIKEIPQEFVTQWGVSNTTSGCTIDLNDDLIEENLKSGGYIKKHKSF